MNNFKKISSLIIYSLVSFGTAFAQGGLVPCSGLDCKLCNLFELGKRIIDFIVQISLGLAVIFIVYGALTMMISAGNEKRITAGKESMTIAVTGLVIVLAGWLIISEILFLLTGSRMSIPWNTISC